MFCLLELHFLKPNDCEKTPLEVLDYLRAKIRQGCRIDYKVVAVQGSVMPIPPYLQVICQPAPSTVNARQQTYSEVGFTNKFMYLTLGAEIKCRVYSAKAGNVNGCQHFACFWQHFI
jgi:hypothetical protein